MDNQQELSKCLSETVQLGHILEANASQAFRDAHLENRLITFERSVLLANNYDYFCEWIMATSPEQLFEWLKKSTYDIDFETGFWLVSTWDDPLHILWSSNIGHNQAKELQEGWGLLETWWRYSPQSSSDEEIFWITLLCRSLREFCRRHWYDHVMPDAYHRRYKFEQREHFIELALTAANHLGGYTYIKALLNKCQSSGNTIWNSAVKQTFPEPVVASPPLFVSESAVTGMTNNDDDR